MSSVQPEFPKPNIIEEIISKESLQDRLEAVKQVITKRQQLYYHIEAIHNFIYHLNNLQSERTQERAAQHIHNYLAMLQKRINQEHDLTSTAKELTPYVWKIADIYKWDLGFVSRPYYPFQIISWAILFFILRYASSTTIALVAVTVIAIATISYYQLKIKAKKYY